uniref:Uncharacterized protein n=1 Tax=Anthoceros angustus TaxID=48387 RepID=A0A2P1L4W6_ANTAG|nr:hypothetical protein AnanMp62 [Anthoceros angustus]AVP12842.1 hypothetical protein AnanMp62 [Anthoceros angustus]
MGDTDVGLQVRGGNLRRRSEEEEGYMIMQNIPLANMLAVFREYRPNLPVFRLVGIALFWFITLCLIFSSIPKILFYIMLGLGMVGLIEPTYATYRQAVLRAEEMPSEITDIFMLFSMYTTNLVVIIMERLSQVMSILTKSALGAREGKEARK